MTEDNKRDKNDKDDKNNINANAIMEQHELEYKQNISNFQGRNDDIPGKKHKLLKEYFDFYKKNLNLKIVDYIERDETEEEYKIRKEAEEKEREKEQQLLEKQKQNNTNKKNKKILDNLAKTAIKRKSDDEILHKKIIRELKPGNILMKEQYTLFFKWIASQLQIIKDFKISDAIVNNIKYIF